MSWPKLEYNMKYMNHWTKPIRDFKREKEKKIHWKSTGSNDKQKKKKKRKIWKREENRKETKENCWDKIGNQNGERENVEKKCSNAIIIVNKMTKYNTDCNMETFAKNEINKNCVTKFV